MNSWYHSQASARKWGGNPEDYIEIHSFIDSSKRIIGDVRHRSMYHHTEGIFLCERIFGRTITVGGPPQSGMLMIPEELAVWDEGEKEASDAAFTARILESLSRALEDPPVVVRGTEMPVKYRPREVPVRLIAELHVEQDLGWIPSPKDFIDGMVLKPWMGGPVRREQPLTEIFPREQYYDTPRRQDPVDFPAEMDKALTEKIDD